MATFAKANFGYKSYASLRPSYPRSLYNAILSYHQGPRNFCVDLGCGPGIVTRAIAEEFDKVIGADPSSGMIEQAQAATPAGTQTNYSFTVANAEKLDFAADGSVDAIVAGQAAHWFDYPRAWAEWARVLRKGGTVAYWTYGNPFIVHSQRATDIIHEWSYNAKDPDKLGPYWSYPGRGYVENYYRGIEPASDVFADVRRIEYVPGTNGPRSGTGDKSVLVLGRRATLGEWRQYFRTWSAWHGWHEAHPDVKPRSEGGTGDVMDKMFDEMAAVEGWTSEDVEVEIEWGTALVLARRR